LSSDVFTPAVQRHRKVRSDSVANRERVLAAAREVFAEAGLDALIPDIAARAGVGKGTVYRHFPTKDALVQALLDAFWRHRDEVRQQALDNDDPWVGFTNLLWGTLTIPPEHRVACDILIALHADKSKPPIPAVRIRIDEALVTLFRRAQEAGAARQDIPAETMPLMFRSISMAVKAGREMHTDWQPYLTVVLDGLRATPR
jgi:AcrR family transcriptional regulator